MTSVSNQRQTAKTRPSTPQSYQGPRFGLFSYIGPLSASQAPSKPFRKRPDGSVQTAKRNITASRSSSLFSRPQFVSVGDSYTDKENPHTREGSKKELALDVH